MTSATSADLVAPGAGRWARLVRRDWWWDLVPALPLLGICLGGTGRAGEDQAVDVPAPAYVLVAVGCLALLLRRARPRTTLVVAGLALTAYLAAGYPFGPVLFVGPVAVHAVVTRLPWRRGVLWGAGLFAVTAVATVARFRADGSWVDYLSWFVAWAAVLSAPAAIGLAVAVRARSEAEVRAEQARRAVADERLALARDVHDGVGHGLAVIAMQSGVALHVLDAEPERARELLTTIRATSREALDDLRADLDRLRTGDPSPVRPGPDLTDLPALLDRMRDGGLVVHGELSPGLQAPQAVSSAAYRIAQESLTNVLRHAGATDAWVVVRGADDEVLVEVVDRGRGGAVTGDGSGISGMRSRAAALGGTVEAGPREGGGFAVRARLPVRS